MKILLILLSLVLSFQVASSQYVAQPVSPNLPAFSSPTDLEFLPDGSNRAVVLEQRGSLWIIENSSTTPTRRLFFDGKTVVTQNGCEAGLLGCAFHPDYTNNHFVYLSYDTGSDPQWYSRIVRYLVSTSNPDSLIPSSAYDILTFPQPKGRCNHKGGCLRFGPDGFLYASFGDGGSGGDPDRNGQNRTVFLGKILRLDVDHQANGNHYAIPSDNPFAGNTQGFKQEIYAYGLRNTWKFSFDKSTGKLWAGDVGQDAYEEIDIITNGGNYGWNVMEGFHCYPLGDFNCDSTGMIPPIWEYPHNGNSVAITGGFVYHGSALPSLIGKYIYADYVEGKIWALSYDGTTPATNQLLIDQSSPKNMISSFGEDQTGEIFALGNKNGKMYKLTTPAGVQNNSPGKTVGLIADRTFLDEQHPTSNIRFIIPENQHIQLSLIDEKGVEIQQLLDREMERGEQSIQLNTASLINGIYFIRLQGNFATESLKIIVQK
ncbi:MAG: PQQ-dependent sugar dehydrogenase [Candidatus Kapaibacterium sp.]